MATKVLVKEKTTKICDKCGCDMFKTKSNPGYDDIHLMVEKGDLNGYGKSITGFKLKFEFKSVCLVAYSGDPGSEMDICKPCIKKMVKSLLDNIK